MFFEKGKERYKKKGKRKIAHNIHFMKKPKTEKLTFSLNFVVACIQQRFQKFAYRAMP